MAKSLFKNYNYSFDANEIKLLTNFCNQAVKQMESDKRFAGAQQSFLTII